MTATEKPPSKRVRLFRNGRSQAVRIPKEFEFAGDEVELTREGDVITLRPVLRVGSGTALAALLKTFETVDENPWADIPDPPPAAVDPFGHE
jgi:antitoxin VapB